MESISVYPQVACPTASVRPEYAVILINPANNFRKDDA